jgi:hypothetical protein
MLQAGRTYTKSDGEGGYFDIYRVVNGLIITRARLHVSGVCLYSIHHSPCMTWYGIVYACARYWLLYIHTIRRIPKGGSVFILAGITS